MKFKDWAILNNSSLLHEVYDNIPDCEYNATKKIYWKCKNGHKYDMEIRRRTVENRGCPYCSGKRVSDEYNSLYKLRPDLADEWDYDNNDIITPHDITPGSNKEAYWICKNGHRWKTIIANRGLRNSGCPECAKGTQTSRMERLLYTVIKETFINVNSRVKLDGFEYDIHIPNINIAIEYNGRYYHNNKYSSYDVEDRDFSKRIKAKELGITLIIIEEEYSKNMPYLKDVEQHIIAFGADNMYNREYYIIENIIDIMNLMLQEQGINIIKFDQSIYNKFVEQPRDIVENSLGDQYPELLDDWDKLKNGVLTPFMIKPKSNKLVWWKCNICNYSWKTSPAHRTLKHAGCPACLTRSGSGSGTHLVLEGINDLRSLRPDIFSQIDLNRLDENIDINKLSIKSNKRIWWRCSKCSGSWEAPVSRRVDYNSGCPYCSNRKVLQGFNDLRTIDSKLADEFDEVNIIKSDETLAFSNKMVKWKCSVCNEIWKSQLSDRVRGGKTCPFCGGVELNNKCDLSDLY